MTKMSSRGLKLNSAVLSSGGYHINRGDPAGLLGARQMVTRRVLYAAAIVVVVSGIALRLDGLWMHVGTPDAVRDAEDALLESIV